MHEIELKYQVPARRRAAVAKAVAGRVIRLQAAYVDTPDRSLATAGLALRMRREGRVWVQTLKGEATDGMTRLEHNVTLPGRGEAMPDIDPARHAGTPAGELLDQALAAAAQPRLMVLFRTDIQRRRRALDTPHGRVELALDEGFIEAGGTRLPVCELEIELLSGSPAAVLIIARDWVTRHGLWLDTRTKAERGERLSRAGAAAVMPAAPAAPAADALPAAARRAVLSGCWRQIGAAASEIAGGSPEVEHLHQLRVALRRLRSLQRLLRDIQAPPPAWLAGADDVFSRLGPARDRDAFVTAVWPQLEAALGQAGMAPAQASRLWADVRPDQTPGAVVRGKVMQMLLIDLLEAVSSPLPEAPPEPRSVRAHATRRLQRWHRQVLADVQRFDELDEAGRHTLRKRVKRLRYATEWAAPLYPRRKVQRYLAALRDAQSCLGEISDTTMAWQALSAPPEREAAAMFALGWLTAGREALLAVAPRRLAALAEVARYWRRG